MISKYICHCSYSFPLGRGITTLPVRKKECRETKKNKKNAYHKINLDCYFWCIAPVILAIIILYYCHMISCVYCTRSFRLPAVLVGDGRLGGISGTIAAYECLKLRGYDVVALVLQDHGLVNEVPLLSYLRDRYVTLTLPSDLLVTIRNYICYPTISSLNKV